ncbi:clostridium cellulosome enzyme, dockerin type I [Treponema primitia ZAS-2]|uniref:Clostridium cellulosome enzyme, dockerin type I n=2 Tax=Treponema primitia TaxID=88058 RepID=F5YMQ8_TREPZ|nr:clostridium cellulosome enzyme, dockerin type I [Treponema primitia ZAS-2]
MGCDNLADNTPENNNNDGDQTYVGDTTEAGDTSDAGVWDGVADTEFSTNTDAAAILAAIYALEADSGDYESAVPDSAKDTTVPAVSDAASIVLDDGHSTVTPNDSVGITIDDTNNIITITAEGTYALSGSLSDGQVIVDVDKNVNLILNGVNITSSKGAPLALFGKKKKIISLAEGTQNTLTDAAAYTSFYKDDEPNGALFSKKALTINGSGSLTVNGNYNNGISCKDNLKILGGTITVSAKNNALKGNDSVVIKGGDINITSDADGIKSDADDEGAGYVYISGDAKLSIRSAEDGIQAYRAVHILEDAVVNIRSGGGTTSKTTGYDGDTSCKGIKSDLDLLIEDGTFNLDCLDDAIHSNNGVLISGGTFSIKTDDDAIHGDSLAVINGGNISITKSYEGLEAAKVVVNGGTINMTASDDGINAADGTSTTPMQRPGPGGGPGWQPGQGGMAANTNCAITINGGNITVNAGGDGIDSNGNVWISGGFIVVHGPTSSGDGALDSDGTFFIDGGVLLAAGSAGMAQKPSTTSTQYSLAFTFSGRKNVGTQVVVKDSKGETMADYTGAKQFQSLIISSPDLVNGGVYSVYIGNALSKTFTVSSKVTSVSL